MPTLRTIVMAAGAVAAAGGVATLAVVLKPHPAEEEGARRGYELCFKSDLVFFEDAPAKCYAAEDVRGLQDRHVLDKGGSPAILSMAHPSDASIAPADCRTCAQYREARFNGWLAKSARDMRREAYFVRACGALAAIAEAQPAEKSFFEDGAPSQQDMADFADDTAFGETSAPDRRIEAGGAHNWRITAGETVISMQELANADFDNDGSEEILVYFTGGLAGGTAAYYDIGYLEKDAAGARLQFTPVEFDWREAGPAGG